MPSPGRNAKPCAPDNSNNSATGQSLLTTGSLLSAGKFAMTGEVHYIWRNPGNPANINSECREIRN